ncbi:MAG TPA: phosphate acyltransferase PlsX [Planctomycetes bacterium]|nr:phosphate acyltransferase PlsX [Planctomycetota bacterium]
MPQTRIALDAMGGDDAPGAILGGALRAVSAGMDAARILLVGDAGRIESFLGEHGGNPGFEILPASQVIEMGDSPAQALRAKPDASIAVAVRAIREGQAGSLVSMGNTGACVGASTLGLGTLQGVRRPGIAVTLELTGKPLTLLDMGANIAPKPDHLVQYAAMGSVYSRECLEVAAPRVGLLNVGEEAGKGTQLLKEAYPLLEASGLEFVGNVEGSDLFHEACDVVVTDGFTGNVVLKLLEHFAGFMLGMMLRELDSHQALGWGREALGHIRRSIDYSTYGGALLLGVNGVVVIGHGRSDESAVANALELAARALDTEVNRFIERGLATG